MMRSLLPTVLTLLILIGCAGEQGEAGPEGPQGAPGVDGLPGADGKDGLDGEPGEQGPQGLRGDPGAKGEDGEPGKQGEPGEQGEEGEQGEQGPEGDAAFDVVFDTESAPAEACPTGGKRVLMGLDNGDGSGTAHDGKLQEGEVDTSVSLCDGAAGGLDGFNALVKVEDTTLTPCPNGGQHLSVGLDDGAGSGTARDGILQPDEIRNGFDLCSGATGEAGPQGEQGPQGPEGPPGPAGGFATTVWVDAEGTIVSEIPGGGQVVWKSTQRPYYDENGYIWSIDTGTLELKPYYYPSSFWYLWFTGSNCTGSAFTGIPGDLITPNVVIFAPLDYPSADVSSYVLPSSSVVSTQDIESYALLSGDTYSCSNNTHSRDNLVAVSDFIEVSAPTVPYVAPLHPELR